MHAGPGHVSAHTGIWGWHPSRNASRDASARGLRKKVADKTLMWDVQQLEGTRRAHWGQRRVPSGPPKHLTGTMAPR